MSNLVLITTALITITLFVSQQFQSKTEQLEARQQFEEWKARFNVRFSDIEDQYRFEIYQENLQLIKNHNQREEETYKLGVNQFMHLTNSQFANLYLQPIEQDYVREQSEIKQQEPLKASIDYRNFTIVKEQGQCGAWPFSVTGTIEVYQRIYYSRNVSLSEQQLIDCDTLSRGCTGGSNINGYKYAQAYGLATTTEYPYVGHNQTCKQKYGSYNITRYNSAVGEYSMKQALNHHPVSVGLDAQNWQFYTSGVFSNCGITLNHYAVVVGYEESGDWIVKNSWGRVWGENGFIRIKSGNTCGLLSYAYQDQY